MSPPADRGASHTQQHLANHGGLLLRAVCGREGGDVGGRGLGLELLLWAHRLTTRRNARAPRCSLGTMHVLRPLAAHSLAQHLVATRIRSALHACGYNLPLTPGPPWESRVTPLERPAGSERNNGHELRMVATGASIFPYRCDGDKPGTCPRARHWPSRKPVEVVIIPEMGIRALSLIVTGAMNKTTPKMRPEPG